MLARIAKLINISALLLIGNTGYSQSLLWRISGAEAGPSYLFGTIHIKDKRVFELSDSVLLAQERCSSTVLELDLSSQTNADIAQLMLLPHGRTLADIYSAGELAQIEDIIHSRTGMSMQSFMHLKPVALLSLVAESYFSTDMPYSLDEHLQKRAQTLGKPVIGLETVTEQFTALASISHSIIYDYLTDTASTEQLMLPMLSAYLSADLVQLSALMAQDSLMVTYNNELVVRRNHKMAERISPIIKSQSSFIAVGAGHLAGDEGLIALLRQQGYQIEPVR